MKKIALYILCGVTALFTSCDPSLLDLQNENTLSTGVYWKTESDVEAGVVAVYGMFYRQGTWTRNIYTQMIGMADEGVSYAGWTELNEYTKFIFTDYNFSEVNAKIWREHYTAIFRANQVLAMYRSAMKHTGMTSLDKLSSCVLSITSILLPCGTMYLSC